MEVINQIPNWYKDKTKQYDLVLSNDNDSLISCNILTDVMGWEVHYYYQMDRLYGDRTRREAVLNGTANERVWVDVAKPNVKAFDNHVSRFSDEDNASFTQMINPNLMTGVDSRDYYSKYCGSTALMLYWLYDIPLPSTDEGKAMLLCLDSAYLGHYKFMKKIKEANAFYIGELFGFGELIDLMNSHQQSYFDNMKKAYHVNDDFQWKNGVLHAPNNLSEISKLLEMEIQFPEIDEKHYAHVNYNVKAIDFSKPKWQGIEKISDLPEKVFSIAFTYKSNAVMTIAR